MQITYPPAPPAPFILSGPVSCATKECGARVTCALYFRQVPIAYACTLPHLKEMMWATRHLGEQRLIEALPA